MSESKQAVSEPTIVDSDEQVDREQLADGKSSEQLDEAIETSNILDERTRHAKPQSSNQYTEARTKMRFSRLSDCSVIIYGGGSLVHTPDARHRRTKNLRLRLTDLYPPSLENSIAKGADE
ncbi:hypothetical protein N7456_006815 [Penicillium angulare]|uniref:Uncharacterized protein n=1 Tax=Penicillium angulare TaxID=116970 RepID=A0A9W9FIB5_9EURO|nr:hypothetical protein N7456_006815 [Penicillium angulare]